MRSQRLQMRKQREVNDWEADVAHDGGQAATIQTPKPCGKIDRLDMVYETFSYIQITLRGDQVCSEA